MVLCRRRGGAARGFCDAGWGRARTMGAPSKKNPPPFSCAGSYRARGVGGALGGARLFSGRAEGATRPDKKRERFCVCSPCPMLAVLTGPTARRTPRGARGLCADAARAGREAGRAGMGRGAEPRRRHGRLAGRALTVCARGRRHALWAPSPHGQRREKRGASIPRSDRQPAAARSGTRQDLKARTGTRREAFFAAWDVPRRAPRRVSGLSMAFYGLCFSGRWRLCLGLGGGWRCAQGRDAEGAKVRRVTEPSRAARLRLSLPRWRARGRDARARRCDG